MRRKLQTAFVSVVIFFFLFASFYLHLFRDVFSVQDDGTLHSPSTIAAFTLPINRTHHDRQNLVIAELLPPPPPDSPESVLLPAWEVLLFLPASFPPPPSDLTLSCFFQDGSMSLARSSGTVPGSHRPSFRCSLPTTVRRLRPFYTPRLIGGPTPFHGPDRSTEMLRWNYLAYESVSTSSDVVVFAKGVNNRQGVNRAASELRCAFLSPGGGVVATTAVTSSAQEVFRCTHPNTHLDSSRNLRVSLEIGDQRRVLPSLATYRPARAAAHDKPSNQGRSLICACTMVFNAAKFLPEWVAYHAKIGVDRFVLYDNGSEDELESVVSGLVTEGYNVSTNLWPWQKTQEAGFSHSAAAYKDSCKWMMFLDVDEFVFSPSWSNSPLPSTSMLRSLLPSESSSGARIGQVSLNCLEFGPSNQRVHPRGGVTQGYTCRRKAEQRHKSLVLLDAVDHSLVNVAHHFLLREGYRTRRVKVREGVVNHYKYQAWGEFKAKFRRRVSAYVADWTEEVNPGSNDRTPGLGYAAVEPKGWASKFCEVNDTRLREVTRRWFGKAGPTGEYKLAWEDPEWIDLSRVI